MGIVAYARALFGGGNPAIAQQWSDGARQNPDQIAPAPGAFPWPMLGILGQQLLHPELPNSGSVGPAVGRWGGNQSLGPAQVTAPAISPAYSSLAPIRNLYGPGDYRVPTYVPVAIGQQYAGAPGILASQAALSPELTAYLNQS
jgi:hypothetical protein